MITAAAAAALSALAAAAAGLGVWAYLAFGKLLALERELRELRRRADAKSREVEALAGVASAVTHPRGRAALAAIVSIVAKSLEADLAAILLFDENSNALVTQPGAYGLDDPELLYQIPMSDETSSSVRVFKSGHPFLTGNAQSDPGVISSYARLWKIHSLMVVPVRGEGRPFGVLRVGSSARDAFTREHLELVSVVADEAAVIVETAILNRKLAETAEQLKGLNRMKDDFVSTVSHEFKTPLTTLQGFLSVMLEGDTGPLTQQQARFLAVSQTAVRRLNQLVEELLDLSRLQGDNPLEAKPLLLETLVRASAERQQPAAERDAKKLLLELPERMPAAFGDERWLGLVIDNLISNALKFTRAGGSVKVRAADKGDFVMLSVSDDGIGIAAEDKPRIFEKFYRSKAAEAAGTPGTGLGLAIAQQVIAKHGGKIWFESEEGKGATFYFVVPSRREAAPLALRGEESK